MSETDWRRIRIYFEKAGDSRFLSHLDLMRTMERALRRSGLPVRFTEGMNPHVRMSFPVALPLGMESRLETMEVQIAPPHTVREIVERLAVELPAGLRPFDGDVCFTGEKWQVAEQHYEVRGEGLPDEAAVGALLARDRIPVLRREKEVDLKPLLSELRVAGDGLVVSIRWTETGTARPEDVLSVLDHRADSCRVVKTGMTFLTSEGDRIRKPHGP
ncbi:MAG: TIGR03936 family radical SAM-associated protein [Planctomycetes bacterium]|jgi:radical SAM-linked protein|nr:TIGR03936 family radical SAM-associated protein [Planctomycetota bacterium]